MAKDSSSDTAVQAASAPRQRLVVQDTGVNSHLFDTARFEQVWRIAEAMALAELLPDHLRLGRDRKPLDPRRVAGNCLLVVNQAIRWGMDPFAIAPETYSVGGKLAYQGKLVAAVVNARAGLQRRLSYEFEGSGDGRTITVSGQFEGDDAPRTIKLSVAQAKTDNQMWRKDPDQKLVYSGVTKWARRHCPEIILGVVTEEDLERIAIDQPPFHADVIDSGRGIKGQSVQDALGPKGEQPKPEGKPAGAAKKPAAGKAATKPAAKKTTPESEPEPEPEADDETGDDEGADVETDEHGEVIEGDEAGADGAEEEAAAEEGDDEDEHVEEESDEDAGEEDVQEEEFTLDTEEAQEEPPPPPAAKERPRRGVSEQLQEVYDALGRARNRMDVAEIAANVEAAESEWDPEEFKLASEAWEEKRKIMLQRAQQGPRKK